MGNKELILADFFIKWNCFFAFKIGVMKNRCCVLTCIRIPTGSLRPCDSFALRTALSTEVSISPALNEPLHSPVKWEERCMRHVCHYCDRNT